MGGENKNWHFLLKRSVQIKKNLFSCLGDNSNIPDFLAPGITMLPFRIKVILLDWLTYKVSTENLGSVTHKKEIGLVDWVFNKHLQDQEYHWWWH